MNKQDKLFNRIKKAAKTQEQQPFNRKEAVWDKVSQKLNPKKRKRMILYRTLSAAAVIAVIIFAGFQLSEPTPNPLTENSVINKDVKLNDTQNTKLVQQIKDELKKAENLDIKYLDSTESNFKKPKQSKKENIVSVEADINAIEDLVEIEDKIIVRDTAEKQNLVSASSENIISKNYDTNQVVGERKAEVAVLEQVKIENEIYTSVNIVEEQEENTVSNDTQLEIKGLVLDEDGLPVPGVNVIVKGTTNGTQTDFDGKFSIETEVGQSLQFTYVGFITQEVKIKNQKDLTITLQPEMEVLEEVVVVSEPEMIQKKYAVSSIVSESVRDDEEVKSSYIVNQLKGRVAGVQINSESGSPGSNTEIIIRGNRSISKQTPLYIVDGKPVSNDQLRALNPKQIKSVNVIKSKADLFKRGYGEKGKNGVIEISTKVEKESDIKPDSIVYWYNQQINYYANNEEYETFKENPFTNPLSEPLSTFSIDVDRAAYTNIRRMINNGQEVPKDAVRIEEMLNFFEYDYDKPSSKHPFAIHTAYSDAPWNNQHKLLRIALQGKDIPIENLPASNLVFLIDVSGSMNNQNKLPLVKKSLNLLVDQMRTKDKIALVTYAGNSQVVLEPTSGKDKTKIKNAINNLSSGGGTYASQGIETAYSLAEENFVKEGNNRVIIATDGDFNIGVTQNESLEDLIAKKRKTNIFLTCLGYGMGNYKDSKMQSLSQKGNGNYAYIDSYQEAQKFLEREFKGSLYAIAKDVKIQIEFNPKHVDSYRLIGYETRLLEDRDFADDTKDAGEIGVNHQVTALYEVIPRGVESQFGDFTPKLKYQKVEQPSFENYSDELATVKFRYKQPDSDTSTKLERIIKNKSVSLSNTGADFKFTTAVAWFGLKLRDSQLISNADKEDIIKLAKEGLENDKEGYRAEFIRLVRLYN